jgi:hypothetical protein
MHNYGERKFSVDARNTLLYCSQARRMELRIVNRRHLEKETRIVFTDESLTRRYDAEPLAGNILTAAEARYLETRDRILARRNPELLAREKAEFEAMTDAELVAVVRRLRPDFDRREPLSEAGSMFSAAEVRSLRICKQTLARDNPELLERMNARFEAMTDAELAAIAWPRSFGADDLNEPPSDENPVELWRRYQQAFALFNALAEPSEEDEATFNAVVDEIERIATDQVPTALEGVLLRLRLIQQSQETTMWGEFEDNLIARAIEGLEAMATAAG